MSLGPQQCGLIKCNDIFQRHARKAQGRQSLINYNSVRFNVSDEKGRKK